MNTDDQTMAPMMTSNYGDNKASKDKELNKTMSITGSAQDDLTSRLRGGLNN